MLLNNCRLVGVLSDGISTECGAVEVESGIIRKVYAEALDTYEGEVFDCGGKTLLPGLIDAHTHLIGIDGYSGDMNKDKVRLFLRTAEKTKKYLEYGYTTVRDCGTPSRVANYIRDGIQAGIIEGPRVISSGLILSPTEIEENDSIYEMYHWGDGKDAMLRMARKELAEHADFIKIMASGSAFHKQGKPVQPLITEEELQAVHTVSELKDTYIAAHAHGDQAIRLCIECGVRTIEHCSYIEDDTIELLKHTPDCYPIPTLAAMYQNPARTSAEMMFLVKKLEDMRKDVFPRIAVMYQQGIIMGFGTDSTVEMDQYDMGIEFLYRKEFCGMKDIDILIQATKNNARILGIDDITGSIRAGLSADLILVEGKPEEDISAMFKKPEAVLCKGKIYTA